MSIRTQVEETIEVIRPALQADGGDIILREVDEVTGIVSVTLTGACGTCPASDQTLKAATFAIIAGQLLSKTEKDALARVFKAFDANGDGKLSMDEVKAGYLEHYGRVISDEEVEKMFRSVDSDNSGFIDYSEFVVAAMNEKQLTTNDKLQAAFKMFDKDSSGMITPNEIKAVLTGGDNKVPNAIIESIISQVDQNGDGEISLQEFQELMRNVSL